MYNGKRIAKSYQKIKNFLKIYFNEIYVLRTIYLNYIKKCRVTYFIK